MPVMKCESLKRSEEILVEITKLLKDFSNNVVAEAWSNGREQGYCLIDHLSKAKAVFAESRNSDSLLCVCGLRDEFDSQTNQPSPELFRTARASFPSVRKAARFIEEFFRQASAAHCMSRS